MRWSKSVTCLQKIMSRFDAEASCSGDHAGYWQSASLLLAIWSSGGIPVAGYSPQVAPDLFKAFKKFGSDLRIAIDARAFPI